MRISILLAFMASPALAQNPPCGPQADREAFLVDRYGEDRVITGRTPGGQVTMWANPETGSWTLTIIRPDGVMCLIGSVADMGLPNPSSAA